MKTISRSGNISISQVCECYDLKRDALYKYRRREHKRNQESHCVLDLVKHERKVQPRVGTRKLYEHLQPIFQERCLKIGRDKLFDILRAKELLIRPKVASCRTTNSYHRFYKYSNLIKDIKVTRSNQVWVSDITYIRTVKGFCYLALITDLFSRKIVGYDVSDTLELSGCLRALNKALQQVGSAIGLIHHSDRGIQYCSYQYVNELKRKKIAISMTEENHCYENAIAERVNGILKDEFYLDQCFFSTEQARRATKNAIKIYNTKRKHLSLNYKTPNMVFETSLN